MGTCLSRLSDQFYPYGDVTRNSLSLGFNVKTERVEIKTGCGENQRWRGGCKARGGERMRDIKIQTVDVREIKKILETERQIIRSKWTREEGWHHMTEVLGRPCLTLKAHDFYLLCRSGNCRKSNKTEEKVLFQFRFRLIYVTLRVKVKG